MELTPTNRKVSRKDLAERRTVFINNKCVRNTCRMSNNNRGKCIFNPASRLKGKQKATKKKRKSNANTNCSWVSVMWPSTPSHAHTHKHIQTRSNTQESHTPLHHCLPMVWQGWVVGCRAGMQQEAQVVEGHSMLLQAMPGKCCTKFRSWGI